MCLICKTAARHFDLICENCRRNRLRSASQGLWFDSLFSYNDAMRFLIWEAKLRCNFKAVYALKEVVAGDARMPHIVKGFDYVLPAPSSLWSRCKGSIDLAWILADLLEQKWGISRLPVPFTSMWRIKKRSRMPNRRALVPDPAVFSGNGRRILLVDDIVTSGKTFLDLGHHFPNDRLGFLALACAYRSTVVDRLNLLDNER